MLGAIERALKRGDAGAIATVLSVLGRVKVTQLTNSLSQRLAKINEEDLRRGRQ